VRSGRRIIGTEQVRDAARRKRQVVEILKGDIVTASARETAETLKIRLVDGPLEKPATPATDGALAMQRALYRRSPKWISPGPALGLNPVRIPRLRRSRAAGWEGT